MKNIISITVFIVLFSCQANNSSAQTKAQTPSLEETLQWIKTKVEKYPSNGIDKVEFIWDKNYNIIMRKFKSKETFVAPNKSIYYYLENEYIYDFDLSLLSPENMKFENDVLTIFTKGNSKSVSYTDQYKKMDCLCYDSEGILNDFKNMKGDIIKSSLEYIKISIFNGEENLFERMIKAWRNAIDKCPKQQTNEKF